MTTQSDPLTADRMTVAVIGLGKIAHDAHLPDIAANPRLDLVAVVDNDPRDPGKPQRVAEQFGNKDKLFGIEHTRWFSDYNLMLAETTPHAVWVCTGVDSHYPIGKAVLESGGSDEKGAHLFTEKPLTGQVGHGVELAQLADSKGLFVRTGYHLPKMMQIRDAIADLGPLEEVYAWWNRLNLVPDGAPFSTGALGDLLGHLLACVLDGTGWPTPRFVSARQFREVGRPDNGSGKGGEEVVFARANVVVDFDQFRLHATPRWTYYPISSGPTRWESARFPEDVGFTFEGANAAAYQPVDTIFTDPERRPFMAMSRSGDRFVLEDAGRPREDACRMRSRDFHRVCLGDHVPQFVDAWQAALIDSVIEAAYSSAARGGHRTEPQLADLITGKIRARQAALRADGA